MAKQELGLFVVNYEIGEPMPGAILFSAHFSVFTPEKTVTGAGRITQAVNPPVNIATRLNGDYTEITLPPNKNHIVLTATGYPVLHLPAQVGIGPVIQPNVELRMILEKDWQSGVASYRFRDRDGEWRTVDNAPVKAVPIEQALAKGK